MSEKNIVITRRNSREFISESFYDVLYSEDETSCRAGNKLKLRDRFCNRLSCVVLISASESTDQSRSQFTCM